jgi:hypothetical protein
VRSSPMRLPFMLVIAAVALAVSFVVWKLTGGTVVFFFLPLLLGLPLLGRRR